jgi:hypothetical protein
VTTLAYRQVAAAGAIDFNALATGGPEDTQAGVSDFGLRNGRLDGYHEVKQHHG